MREALVEHYRPWIREVLHLLRLDHWEIQILSGPPADEDSQGAVSQYTWAHEADLWLGDTFFQRDPLHQAEIVAHEGLHLHQKPYKLAFSNAADVLGHSGVLGTMITALAKDAEETVVDDLGKVLAPFLPPPPPLPGWAAIPPRDPPGDEKAHRDST
jgi:hypothetical protein